MARHSLWQWNSKTLHAEHQLLLQWWNQFYPEHVTRATESFFSVFLFFFCQKQSAVNCSHKTGNFGGFPSEWRQLFHMQKLITKCWDGLPFKLLYAYTREQSQATISWLSTGWSGFPECYKTTRAQKCKQENLTLKTSQLRKCNNLTRC